MHRYILYLLFLLLPAIAVPAQNNQAATTLPDTNKQEYLKELKALGASFSNYYYPNHQSLNALPERFFVWKIDSARKEFEQLLDKYRDRLNKEYLYAQKLEVKYYFDKLLIEYPMNHDVYVGRTAYTIPDRLKTNLSDFNNPDLLSNTDFTAYVKAYLQYLLGIELQKSSYKKSSNQQLDAAWNLIPTYFTNPVCRNYWQFDHLYNHIENNGIKNIEPLYRSFLESCKDSSYTGKISRLYAEDSIGRKNHLIKTYKKAGVFELDLHVFTPGENTGPGKRTAIVYFHGGSWSEGKPDWFFSSCQGQVKKGWVAIAVEYRTYGRHGTLPFEAVKDARSAIRWIRQHAAEYNIDTNRIIASGNSAGGHLVLCTALADGSNESTDALNYSPVPNVLLVNSGVFDLTDRATAWISKDQPDRSLAKQISPVYLARKEFPPALIIHGTNDRNVPYPTAKIFVEQMKAAGNNSIEFQTLENATHFIWYDRNAAKVSALRSEFLGRLGY